MAFDSLLDFEPDPPDHMATQAEADHEYATVNAKMAF